GPPAQPTTRHKLNVTSMQLLGPITFSSRILMFALLFIAGCTHQPPLHRFNYAQIKMGVQARLVVYAPDEPTATRACAAAFVRVAQLDDIMSDYRPTSELLRLCARAGFGPVQVSDEL